MTNLKKSLRNLSFTAGLLSLLWMLPSCSSQTQTENTTQVEDSNAQPTTENPEPVEPEVAEDVPAEEWPDSVSSSGEFEEAEEIATDDSSESTATTEATTSTASNSSESTTKTNTLSGAKVKSGSTTPKTTSSTTKKSSTKKDASISESKLTQKFNNMMALKVSIGDKLDCLRISPIKREDKIKAKRLHDKFLGILPSMLVWVRFEDNKLSKIMKNDPESLAKLNTMSDGWQASYESVNKQADAILENYKEKEFYSKCKGS